MRSLNYDKQKFADEINSITSSLSAVLQRKNADYGNNVDKNIDEWGLSSLAIRLDDKLNRFKNLIKEGNTRQVSDEAIEDTLLDLAGYAILGYRKIQEMNQGVAVFDSEGFDEPKELFSHMKNKNLNIDRKPVGALPKSNNRTFTFSE